MKKSLLLMLFLALTWCWTAKAETQTFDFSSGIPSGWITSNPYPWVVAIEDPNGNPITGIKSSNSGVGDSNSMISATFTFLGDGSITFHAGCWGEGTGSVWDKCIFIIDGTTKFQYGALQSWDTYSFDVDAGEHTFTWNYSKDGSVDEDGDAFFLDNVVVNLGSASAPQKPINLSCTGVTTTTATLSWTETGTATAWEIMLNDDENNLIQANSNPFTIPGLTAATSYSAKVRATDGNEVSAWSAAVNFITECEIISNYPWSENFDGITIASEYTPTSRTLPVCWSVINACTHNTYKYYPTVYYYSYTNYANSTPNCLRLYSYYSSYTDYDPQPQYAILPEMENLEGKQITLWARGYNAASSFKIGWMSDPTDVSTFNLIDEQTFTSSNYSTYQELTYEIPATISGNYIAIMIDAASSSRSYNGVYIDDIVIANPPSCLKPTDLACTAVTTTTATLSWTNGAEGQTAWQICINGDEENLVDADSNPFDVINLKSATVYSFKVRANCGSSDQSEWSNEISVTTQCDVIAEFPWSEDFNTLTVGIPVCWDNSDGTTTTDSYKWNYYATGHEGAGLRFNSFSNSSGYTNFLKTPVMNFPAGKIMQLSFWYKNPTGGDFSVFISTDGGATYTTELATGLTNTSDWTEKNIVLSDYVDAQNVVIIFKGTSNYGNGDAYLYLDDVKVEQAPACLKPTDLEATPSSQTATLTWNSEASGFDIAYSTDATANPDENVVGNSSTNTYSKSNLALDTDHYFWVRANCGTDGTSEWVGPISVHIGYCVPGPTSRDGKGITGVAFGQGVDVVNNSDADGLPNASPYYGDYKDQIGAVQAGVESTIAITTSTSSWPYTFVIWVDLDNDLTFEDEEIIYTGKCASGAGTLNANIMIPATQALGDYRMRIAGADSYFNSFYNNGGALDYEANHDPCLTGSIYAVFHDYTLRVLAAPSCLKPTGLEINYTGGLTAEVSWTGEAMLYNIDVNGTVTNGVTSPYELSGLELATTYEVKVQADCGSGSLSDWTSAVSFSTDLCMPEDQCILTFELTDSYGDSWNGNAILVTDVLTGKVLGEMANEDLNGTSGYGENEVNIKTLSVCNGREIQFSWVTGSYPGETSYVVKDVNGQVIFSGSGAMSDPVNYIVDCSHKFYLEIGASGYATFYDEDYAYTMPADLSGHAFSIQNAPEKLVEVYTEGNVVPADMPLVMKAADGVTLPKTFALVPATGGNGLPSGVHNDLIGVNAEKLIADEAGQLFYVLSLNAANDVDSIGFYWMNSTGAGGFTMPAHKAYLKYGASSAPAAFYLFNGENNATWLNSLEGVEGTVKFMHEGNIYILRDSIIYDATGRKVRELK